MSLWQILKIGALLVALTTVEIMYNPMVIKFATSGAVLGPLGTAAGNMKLV